MKNIFNFGGVLLFSIAVALSSSAQTAQNLVAGVGPLTNASAIWSDKSAINLISGSTLFSASGKNTVLYLGFTQAGGPSSEVDIGGMVLYTTERNRLTIKAVTPVTLGGVGSGAFFLNPTNCAVVPSVLTPCVVRLDPLSLKLSSLNDYYFVIYFTNTTANIAVDAAISLGSHSTIVGGIDPNRDDTKFLKGDVLPSNLINKGDAFFLVGVMNN